MDLRNYLFSILISLSCGVLGLFGVYKLFDWLTPNTLHLTSFL